MIDDMTGNKPHTCSDDAPLAALLACYWYIFARNPALWLKGIDRADLMHALELLRGVNAHAADALTIAIDRMHAPPVDFLQAA